eukprot:1186767-Prorocentrum_minimum.AAC.2
MGALWVYWGCSMGARRVYWGCGMGARRVYWGCGMGARRVYWGSVVRVRDGAAGTAGGRSRTPVTAALAPGSRARPPGWGGRGWASPPRRSRGRPRGTAASLSPPAAQVNSRTAGVNSWTGGVKLKIGGVIPWIADGWIGQVKTPRGLGTGVLLWTESYSAKRARAGR